ncbi:unnamed protein product [Caenorhabditis brenneri]
MQGWRLGQHPRPGPNPHQRSLSRQHPPPEKPIQIIRYTFRQFFGHDPPFKTVHINRFVQFEDEWAIGDLPPRVMDRGGLRLYVWRQLLPNPAVHYEQSAIRLKLLTEPEAQDFERFFMAHCRAQHNRSTSTRTGRCPLCSSQLLGYKICDHDRDRCPLQPLTLEQRLQWVGINFLAYCPYCHSRSANHPKENCKKERKTCEFCKKMGHSPIQGMCYTDIGSNPDQQLIKVNRYRKEYLLHIRTLLQNQARGLRYQLRSDHSYVPEISDRTAVEDRCGYHVLCEGQEEFPEFHLSAYSNFATMHSSHYPSLVPPELYSHVQLPIPTFDRQTEEYLEVFAQRLTEYRMHGDFEDINWPPYPLPGPDEGPDNSINPEDLTFRTVSVDLANATLDDTLRDIWRDVPLPPREPSPDNPLLPRIPLEHEMQFAEENFPGYERPPPTPAEKRAKQAKAHEEGLTRSIAVFDEMMLRGQQEDRNDRRTPAQSSTTYATSRETFAQHLVKKPTQPRSVALQLLEELSSSPEQSEELSPSPEPTEANDETDNLQTATEERMVNDEALSHCHEVARVDNKPARSDFQRLAFQSLTEAKRHRPPLELRSALIERIETYQIIFTGARDFNLAAYARASQQDLKQYIGCLQRYGMALDTTHLLYVQLETENPQKIHDKLTMGTDILYIPGFRLWSDRTIRDTMDTIIGRHLENFQNTTFNWFFPPPDPLPGDLNKETEEALQIKFTNVQRPLDQVPYYFQADDIIQYLDLPIPITKELLITRIKWSIRYLTGTEYPNQTIAGTAEHLSAYLSLIRSSASLLLDLSNHHKAVEVRTTTCISTIATEAARGHNIVLPTAALFIRYPVHRWTVFVNLAWGHLSQVTCESNERKREGCDCTDQDVLLGQPLPRPGDED